MMTAEEKNSLVRFIELSAAVTGGGYREHEDSANSFAPNELKDTQTESTAAASISSTTPEQNSGGAVPGESSSDSLELIAAEIRSCTACKLCTTRKNAVPGEGTPKPLVMVIGEGPGADEDASGRPFVGRAGQLLDKMLASIGLYRESNCFIANVIKCRPPANRDPQPDETAACASFLERQIQLLQPGFILCAGRVAGQTLLNTPEPIGTLRGKFIDYDARGRTIPFLATYHPSALLRNEAFKRPAWEDLKLLRTALDQ